MRVCRDCSHFRPDPIGREGLGDCAAKVDRGNTLKRHWEREQWYTVLEKRLIWPGSEGCDQYKTTTPA